MAQEEEAMEEGNCKVAAAQGLSWRSRSDHTSSWWTSAVDLSSTFISKMDQVPASLVGFTLPWHAGARGDQSKAQREAEFGESQPVELPKPRNEIAKPEIEPLEIAKPPLDCEPVDSPKGETEDSPKGETGDSPKGETEDSPKGDTEEAIARSLTPRGAESRRRTKRMPVDLAPAGPKQDSDAPIRSKKLSAVSQEFLLGQGQGRNPARVHAVEISRLQRHRENLSNVDAVLRRVDDSSVLSSSRSLCPGSLLNNPPHALPPPPHGTIPAQEFLPGDSNPNPEPNRICKDSALGGSLRVTARYCEEALEVDIPKASSASLPSSPRASANKESRASKLFRSLGISTRVENEIGGARKLSKEKGLQVVNNLIVSQHQKFAKSLEPRKPGITNGVHPNGNALVEHSRKKSSSRWLFKWRWGSKPALKLTTVTPQGSNGLRSSAILDPPPANITIRDTFYEKADRSSRVANSEPKSLRHRRSSSWGCASQASTAVITPVRSTRRSRIHQDDNDATANMVESRMDCDISLSFRASEAFQDCHGSFRVTEDASSAPGSFRSAVGESQSDVFEDCHGSFRSITTAGSCASFRSVGSPSVDDLEWDHRLPPPLQADQTLTLTIGDVAALCNSSLKFVFKCREIQHFNKFLRSQKKRLLGAGNCTDCFNVILSGTDIEVSSMVAAMSYAWFLDSTVPKVTGEITWHAVPMIDIPRHQMHKHKDAAWLFDACGIDPAALLFADEMELASLVGAGRIKISTIGQDVLVTRNEVGSVCTLLGEKLVAEAQCLLEPRYMKTLLLAGVLLDTENLDFASMRDTEMTTTLLVGSGSLGRNGFFDQLREVEDDDQVSKFITRSYGDGKQLSGRKISSAAQSKMLQQELADQEQSDKDSLFTQSQDQTSTSEAGTSSSLDEDSPRLKQRSSFKYTKLPSHSALARSHKLQSPSSSGCIEDEKAAAHIRKAATQFASPGLSSCGTTRSSNSQRIRKKLILYQA